MPPNEIIGKKPKNALPRLRWPLKKCFNFRHTTFPFDFCAYASSSIL
jgi:hypothetical protein